MTCLTFRQITRSSIIRSMLNRKKFLGRNGKQIALFIDKNRKLAGLFCRCVSGKMMCYIHWPLQPNLSHKSKFIRADILRSTSQLKQLCIQQNPMQITRHYINRICLSNKVFTDFFLFCLSCRFPFFRSRGDRCHREIFEQGSAIWFLSKQYFVTHIIIICVHICYMNSMHAMWKCQAPSF